MKDLTTNLFFCYAWEDLADVQKVANTIKHELSVTFDFYKGEEKTDNLEDDVFPQIDQADVILVFISDTSKASEFVKECIVHANNANKRILPVMIGKKPLFTTMPDEFKFRSKVVDYKDEEQRSRFLGQLKATFGTEVEEGDNYGCQVHISTDMDVVIHRYGKELCVALVRTDNQIRLTKGTHKLDICNKANLSQNFSISYEVKNNEGEQFLEINFRKEFEKAEKKRREELRKAAERAKPMSKGKKFAIFLMALAVIIGGVYGCNYYNEIYLPEKIDREAPRLYVLPDGLYIRTSKMSDVSNKEASVFFGQELITYEQDSEWSYVKLKRAGMRGKEGTTGYVKNVYLVEKKDLYLLRSILGNDDAKKVIETSKCRHALIDYFNANGYIGKLTDTERNEAGISIQPSSQNQWQFFSLEPKAKSNTSLFKKAWNLKSKYKDAFIILKNIVTDERKLVWFRYDDDETPHFVREMEAPYEGLLKNIKVVGSGDEAVITPEYVSE